MARFTIMEFAKALGLGTTRDKVTHAGVILKTLSKKGLAPVVGKTKPHTGRPAHVYDVDNDVIGSLGLKSPKNRVFRAVPEECACELTTWKVLEMTNLIRAEKNLPEMNYDDFAWRLRKLAGEHKGRNNPYLAHSKIGCMRIFSKRSAFLISRKISAMNCRQKFVWRLCEVA